MTPSDCSAHYLIFIEGQLDPRWLRWFDELEIEQRSDGTTAIRGMLDQSALFGILNRIRDLGLTLISVQRQ